MKGGESVVGYLWSNVTIDAIGIVIVSLILTAVFIDKGPRGRNSKYFKAYLILVIARYVTDILCRVLERESASPFSMYFLQGLRLIIGTLLPVALLLYLLTHPQNEVGSAASHNIIIISAALCYATFLMIVTDPLHKLLFTIEDGEFVRSGYTYYLSQICNGFSLVTSAVITVRNREISMGEKLSLLSCALLPMAASAAQHFAHRIAIINVIIMIMPVVLFLFSYVKRGKELAEQRASIAEAQISLTLSQIQPHFIYNSLSSISTLCTIDPQAAAVALDGFTEYLRVNLTSLKDRRLIHFSDELEHVRTYLKLEKMRFGDRLSIEYDIAADDFYLPVLTVQPIVENAVRCGICGRADGVRVKISTVENERETVVIVEDDGEGFDPTQIWSDGKEHVGIANVRSRLASMCGGSLHIDSRIGEGTAVYISIPVSGKGIGN